MLKTGPFFGLKSARLRGFKPSVRLQNDNYLFLVFLNWGYRVDSSSHKM